MKFRLKVTSIAIIQQPIAAPAGPEAQPDTFVVNFAPVAVEGGLLTEGGLPIPLNMSDASGFEVGATYEIEPKLAK